MAREEQTRDPISSLAVTCCDSFMRCCHQRKLGKGSVLFLTTVCKYSSGSLKFNQDSLNTALKWVITILHMFSAEGFGLGLSLISLLAQPSLLCSFAVASRT